MVQIGDRGGSIVQDQTRKILSQYRAAITLGVGTIEGSNAMRLSIQEFLEQPWASPLNMA